MIQVYSEIFYVVVVIQEENNVFLIMIIFRIYYLHYYKMEIYKTAQPVELKQFYTTTPHS